MLLIKAFRTVLIAANAKFLTSAAEAAYLKDDLIAALKALRHPKASS